MTWGGSFEVEYTNASHTNLIVEQLNVWEDSEGRAVHPLFIVFLEVCVICYVELCNIVVASRKYPSWCHKVMCLAWVKVMSSFVPTLGGIKST